MDPPATTLPGLKDDWFACYDKEGELEGKTKESKKENEKLLNENEIDDSVSDSTKIPDFFSTDVFFSPLYFTTGNISNIIIRTVGLVCLTFLKKILHW